MDLETLAVYNAQAARIAARHRAVQHMQIHPLIAELFWAGMPTADVGCGSGRDTSWLAAQGFPVIGYDASTGMLAQARAGHPELQFVEAALPDLAGVPDATYANLLCNAVLMHIPRESLPASVGSLARILAPGGRLLITVRSSTAAGEREPDGRLFSHIPPEALPTLCGRAGLTVIHHEARADGERPGVVWQTIVAER